MLKYRSVSKINLHLRILGLLPDRRHELATCFQAIDYGDELSFEESIDLTLTCDDPNLGPQEGNLVWKAAKLLQERAGISRGARIHLRKIVPYGAGLGGGSGDAATALVALNRLWGIGLSAQALEDLGRKLGADVPFLVRGGASWATGAGDDLSRCAALSPEIGILVATPSVAVPTPWAYGSWDQLHPDPLPERAGMTNFPALHSQDLLRMEELRGRLANDFEEVVFPRYPEIQRLRDELVEAGAAAALLSGSGSSVFGLFPSREVPLSPPKDWGDRGVRWRWCSPAGGPLEI